MAANADLDHRLQTVIDTLTTATESQAGFIYTVGDAQLDLCVASSSYVHLVGRVEVDLIDGPLAWVVRNRQPAFFRRGAGATGIDAVDERVTLPQPMLVAPILDRDETVVAVIALHAAGPVDPEAERVRMLDYAAQVVGGMLEAAQLSELNRRSGSALASLSKLSDAINECDDRDELFATVASGLRDLLRGERAFVYAVESGRSELRLAAPDPLAADAGACSLTAVSVLQVTPRAMRGPAADRLREGLGIDASTPFLRLAPVAVGGEMLGLLCVAGPEPIGTDVEMLLPAIANQLALALIRIELVELRAEQSAVGRLFAALAGGAPSEVETAAARVGRDLDRAHFMVHCQWASDRGDGAGYSTVADEVESALRKVLLATECVAEPDRIRAIGLLDRTPSEPYLSSIDAALAKLGARLGLSIGRSEVRSGAANTAAALKEAADSARVVGALRPCGGAFAYSQIGAYRYLVQVDPGASIRDPFLEAVRKLIEYDGRRGTELTATLEQYLANRRRVTDAARALTVHPNTLRQRLDRITALTGLNLESADFLALELALKLARLNGARLQPRAGVTTMST